MKKDVRGCGITNSQIYLEKIIEILPYYIFWKNTESVYLGCNQRFADLVGKKEPSEVAGLTDFDLPWGVGEAESYRDGDQAAMNGKPKFHAEELLIRPDGSRIAMLVSKVPLLDKAGAVIGVLGASADITERKKLEDELVIAREQAESALKAKEKFEALAREKSKVLDEVLKGLHADRYYLSGKYQGIYLTRREGECDLLEPRSFSKRNWEKVTTFA